MKTFNWTDKPHANSDVCREYESDNGFVIGGYIKSRGFKAYIFGGDGFVSEEKTFKTEDEAVRYVESKHSCENPVVTFANR